MAELTIFFSVFYIELFYTLLIFLKLRNTKEMRGFFREGELLNVKFPFPPSLFN